MIDVERVIDALVAFLGAVKEPLLILFGVLLSLGQTEWYERSKEARNRKQLQETLAVELEEIRAKALMDAWSASLYFGNQSEMEARFKGLIDLCRHYHGPSITEGMLKTLESLAARSESERSEAYTQISLQHQIEDRHKILSQTDAPFLKASIDRLIDCPGDYQRRVLDILKHIGMFNLACERLEREVARTFDSSLSRENHAAVRRNADELLRASADRAGLIAAKVTAILEGVTH